VEPTQGRTSYQGEASEPVAALSRKKGSVVDFYVDKFRILATQAKINGIGLAPD
jgi:hypothetical protein